MPAIRLSPIPTRRPPARPTAAVRAQPILLATQFKHLRLPRREGLAFCRAAGPCLRERPPVCAAPPLAAHYYPVRQESRWRRDSLGIFLGGLGVHNFIWALLPGRWCSWWSACWDILFWLILPVLAAPGIAIWGLVEGRHLCGRLSGGRQGRMLPLERTKTRGRGIVRYRIEGDNLPVNITVPG